MEVVELNVGTQVRVCLVPFLVTQPRVAYVGGGWIEGEFTGVWHSTVEPDWLEVREQDGTIHRFPAAHIVKMMVC